MCDFGHWRDAIQDQSETHVLCINRESFPNKYRAVRGLRGLSAQDHLDLRMFSTDCTCKISVFLHDLQPPWVHMMEQASLRAAVHSSSNSSLGAIPRNHDWSQNGYGIKYSLFF